MFESKTGIFFIAGVGFFVFAFISNGALPMMMYKDLPEKTAEQVVNPRLVRQVRNLQDRYPESFTTGFGELLTLAASTQQVALGGLTMFVFGLGTTPLLMLAGVSGQLLSLASRRRLFAAAAWCLLLTGCVSLVRGASHLSWGSRPAAGCPFCAEAAK